MLSLRSLSALFAVVPCLADAGDWTLFKLREGWGLRIVKGQFMTLDGRMVRSKAEALDSLDLRICSDSLAVVPASPDTAYPQGQEWRTLHGPFRFSSWIRSPHPIDIDDLRAGTGIEPPWRKVHGKDDSGFVNLEWIDFCAAPDLLARLDTPTLIRHPFLGLVSTQLDSRPSPTRRWRRVATAADRLVAWPGDTSFALEAPDTLAEDDFRPAKWLVWWPSPSGERWVSGKGSLLQIRETGKPTRFIHFQDAYPRIAQRVEPLGTAELVVEWTTLYGDGIWSEVARIGTDTFRFTTIGGVSGGEGHDIPEGIAKRDAPGFWRIDQKTGWILLKKWRRRERPILE